MIRRSVNGAAADMGGQVLQPGTGRDPFEGVTIDSRAVTPGQAFVAIRGDRFDGHDYALSAAEDGAAALVVHQDLPGPVPEAAAVIRVDDTLDALQRLAAAWLRQVSPQVLAVTGSVGKTTTKELLRGVMALAGPTHATAGNFNNHIGLPLTLLAMPHDTRAAVLEMGMNHEGEIAALAAMARPEVGLITAIAPVHLEGLGSMEAIAAAKAELLMGLREDGTAVIPGQEPLLAPWAARLPDHRVVTFGVEGGDRVQLVRREPDGARGSLVMLRMDGEQHQVRLPLVGSHNASNAAAAAAAALVAGVPPATIAEGLTRPPRLEHRSSLVTVGPYTVLDDCYNASPAAMRAAMDTLAELAGDAPRAALLGAMLELGDQEQRYHREIGAHAAAAGLDLLITVGDLGAEIARGAAAAGMPAARMTQVETPTDGARALTGALDAGWVLIKASHGARLDRAVRALTQAFPPEDTG